MKKYLNQICHAILIRLELMTSTAGKLDKNRYIYLSLNMISFYSNGYTGIESITFFLFISALYNNSKTKIQQIRICLSVENFQTELQFILSTKFKSFWLDQ
jgi:hypothetical protein